MRACRSGLVSVRYRPKPSASDRSGIGSGSLRHATWALRINQIIIKLHWLHFWRFFLLVVVFALAANFPKQISPHEVRPRVAVVPTLSSLVVSLPKLSPGNTLHVLSQTTWQYITKFRWLCDPIRPYHCGWRWIVDLAAWLLLLVAPWVVIMTTHGATGGFGAVGFYLDALTDQVFLIFEFSRVLMYWHFACKCFQLERSAIFHMLIMQGASSEMIDSWYSGVPIISPKSRFVIISHSMLNLKIWFLPSNFKN